MPASAGSGAVQRTVGGLGYELVDVEKSAGGLLRIYIDHPASDEGKAITVEDCERVTRQLQHVLEVEGVAYERLEVSSPGLDRALKSPADFARFSGEQVDITLKAPFKGRKRYRGALEPAADGWRLVLSTDDGKPGARKSVAWKAPEKNPVATKAGRKAPTPTSAQASAAPVLADDDMQKTEPTPVAADAHDLVLDFSFEEVREARLVPAVDFKGRRFAPPDEVADEPRTEAEIDGGRIR